MTLLQHLETAMFSAGEFFSNVIGGMPVFQATESLASDSLLVAGVIFTAGGLIVQFINHKLFVDWKIDQFDFDAWGDGLIDKFKAEVLSLQAANKANRGQTLEEYRAMVYAHTSFPTRVIMRLTGKLDMNS
ncbi:hypothetical protein [Vibrio agarivorans]|uniref:Uncharacterized protein n=1 Tax=Vibrio agarivorans TaxID=153622 RepID=A0ABT7Y7B4_9VIBR|nr:hypothetical protein [Vibrio agarivorans]MDN2483936.1 hypothetical protein [Vibrio agarivorans]